MNQSLSPLLSALLPHLGSLVLPLYMKHLRFKKGGDISKHQHLSLDAISMQVRTITIFEVTISASSVRFLTRVCNLTGWHMIGPSHFAANIQYFANFSPSRQALKNPCGACSMVVH
jgi:hypothetical protein